MPARLSAHWAAQVLAAVGQALVPPEPDFSHTALHWDDDARRLVGRATPQGARTTLRLRDLTLQVLSGGEVAASTSIAGRTLEQALGWTATELERLHGKRLLLPRPPHVYDLPDHPPGDGAPFDPPDTEALEELARYYANASRFQEIVRRETPGASAVRCWPHHFDLATLVTLDPPGTDPETARSIGFGLSPGDDSYAQPYFYLNPWPFPEQREGHPRPAGGAHWHTKDWFGAVLTADALQSGGESDQARRVADSFESAWPVVRSLLEPR